MKKLFCCLSIALAMFAGRFSTDAQGTQFFRITGPAPTAITGVLPNGAIIWTNGMLFTNYMVQTATTPNSTNWVDYIQLPIIDTINTNQLISFSVPAGMVFIPGGEFKMGDSLDGELDAVPTNVYVSEMYMDSNLVSTAEWVSVYTWAMGNGYNFEAGLGWAPNQPIYAINWYDAVKWCNARSQQAGLTPVYYTDPAYTQLYTNENIDAIYPNWSANGYRLPTEAEWEKAARGGLIGLRFPWGNSISESQANYDSNPSISPHDLGPAGYNTNFDSGSKPYTSPVGFFPPNNYGLFDMAGNMYEWCWDWYGTPYGQLEPIDPTGPSSGTSRVIRGGNWGNPAKEERCASRESLTPSTSTGEEAGFRCVISAPQLYN